MWGVGERGGVQRSFLSLVGVGQPQLPSYLLQLREEVGAKGTGLLLSESRAPRLGWHCSLAHSGGMCGPEPVPPQGQGNGQEVGQPTAQTKGSAEPSSHWRSGPWAEHSAPSATQSDLRASNAPFPWGPDAQPRMVPSLCPTSLSSTLTRDAPPTPHHKHTGCLPHPSSIVFKEISGSHQAHPNAPPFPALPFL